MVHAVVIRLVQAAQWTASGMVIDLSGFGLHAGNKYKRKHKTVAMRVGWMISAASIDIETDPTHVKFQLLKTSTRLPPPAGTKSDFDPQFALESC